MSDCADCKHATKDWMSEPCVDCYEDNDKFEPIESDTMKERARCAEICAEVRRTALRQTTGDMAHANGIAVGAEYCERMIRGDKC